MFNIQNWLNKLYVIFNPLGEVKREKEPIEQKESVIEEEPDILKEYKDRIPVYASNGEKIADINKRINEGVVPVEKKYYPLPDLFRSLEHYDIIGILHLTVKHFDGYLNKYQLQLLQPRIEIHNYHPVFVINHPTYYEKIDYSDRNYFEHVPFGSVLRDYGIIALLKDKNLQAKPTYSKETNFRFNPQLNIDRFPTLGDFERNAFWLKSKIQEMSETKKVANLFHSLMDFVPFNLSEYYKFVIDEDQLLKDGKHFTTFKYFSELNKTLFYFGPVKRVVDNLEVDYNQGEQPKVNYKLSLSKNGNPCLLVNGSLATEDLFDFIDTIINNKTPVKDYLLSDLHVVSAPKWISGSNTGGVVKHTPYWIEVEFLKPAGAQLFIDALNTFFVYGVQYKTKPPKPKLNKKPAYT